MVIPCFEQGTITSAYFELRGLSNSSINFPSDSRRSDQQEGKEKAMRNEITHFRYEII